MDDTLDVMALPFIGVFGLATLLIIRSGEVRWHIAALIFCFGVYVGLTPYAYIVTGFVSWLVERF